MSQANKQFLPVAPVVVAVAAASTAFQAVNTSSGDKLYAFSTNTDCFVKRGLSGVGAATSADFLLPAGTVTLFRLARNEGVRVIRSTADGTLTIGDTEL